MLADRLGIPIAAPVAYGGVDIPLFPKRSRTDNVAWLRFLSQQKVTNLIAGIGLSIGVPAQSTWLDKSSRQWLEEYLSLHREIAAFGVGLLTTMPLTDEALRRRSLKEVYDKALGHIRSAEFYFRCPPAGNAHNPSVRVALRKFQRKVRKSLPTPVSGYSATARDIDSKTSLYALSGGGFFPLNPWEPQKPSSHFGMESSPEVKRRYITPFHTGLG